MRMSSIARRSVSIRRGADRQQTRIGWLSCIQFGSLLDAPAGLLDAPPGPCRDARFLG